MRKKYLETIEKKKKNTNLKLCIIYIVNIKIIEFKIF